MEIETDMDVGFLLTMVNGDDTYHHILAIRNYHEVCKNTQPLMGTTKACKYNEALKYIQGLNKENVKDLSCYLAASEKVLQLDFKEQKDLPKTIVDLVENEEARELLQKEFDY